MPSQRKQKRPASQPDDGDPGPSRKRQKTDSQKSQATISFDGKVSTEPPRRRRRARSRSLSPTPPPVRKAPRQRRRPTQEDEETVVLSETDEEDHETNNTTAAGRDSRQFIQAKQMVSFPIVHERLLPWGKYAQRMKTKHNTASNRVSWIWLHGMEIAKYDNRKKTHKGRYFLCHECHKANDEDKQVWSARSTDTIAQHLQNIHHFVKPGKNNARTRAADEVHNNANYNALMESLPDSYGREFVRKFLNWTTRWDLTYRQAAADDLHEVILNGGPLVANLLPSARTLRNWIMAEFDARGATIQDSIDTALSRVAGSMDIWTTGNDLQLLAFVGHWIDKDGKLQVSQYPLPYLAV